MFNHTSTELIELYQSQIQAINGDKDGLQFYRKNKMKENLTICVIYIPTIMLLALFFSGLNLEKYLNALKTCGIIFILPVLVGLLISYISPALDDLSLFMGGAWLIVTLGFFKFLPGMPDICILISTLIIIAFSQWYSSKHKDEKIKDLKDKICQLQL